MSNYMFKPKILIIIIFLMTIITSGCVRVKSDKEKSSIDGGVFKTSNRGDNWQQKVLIPTVSGRPGSFAGVDVASMVMDPGDNKTIYFGSVASSLIYTYDGGNNWQLAKGLGKMTIRAIAVDPKSKCIIYITTGNKVHKSSDCNRSWKQVYYDNDLTTTVDTITIDHSDSSIIYIGVSRGNIIKSFDRGESWQTINRFKDKINKIVIDPNDSRNIYVVTRKKGVFRSLDRGKSWSDLNEIIKEFKFKLDVRDLVFVKDEPGVIFLATYYGILKSNDSGANWEKIELIPTEKEATINAMAVNPQNSKEIYYVTNTTFYRSLDGGQNWTTIKLPTARAGWKLLVDPEEPNIIYMGARSVK